MTRARKALMTTAAIVVLIVVGLILAAPSIQRSIFYPMPRSLPPVVSQTTEQLLARLQAVLESNAPVVANALQPGLSDAQIAELESQGGFRLSGDLRALYRWHNGIDRNSTIWLTAGQRFVPLDEVVQVRSGIGQQVASASGVQRAAYFVFAGHRTGWIQVMDDGSGDGYFYDPKRQEAEGAFFHYFAETSYYLWFPSLRNYLTGLIECYETQAVRVSPDGKTLDEDFERTQKIWERFAKSSE